MIVKARAGGQISERNLPAFANDMPAGIEFANIMKNYKLA